MTEFLPIAEQLRILLEAVLHPSGRPYKMQEISDATGISLATLSQVKAGKIKNPQLSTLRELCQFFHIPLRYFETTSIEACYALLQENQAEGDTQSGEISEIAFRAQNLSADAQRDILTIIKWVQAAERAYEEGRGDRPALPRLTGLERPENED
jgi:transcriptional regulator with XRE-family HTH domain